MVWSSGDSLNSFNLNNRLGVHTFNVKDYGAKGDNSTNDYTSIQSAFIAASSASSFKPSVYFPPGQYRVGSELSVRGEGITIECDGVLMPHSTYTGFLMRVHGNGSGYQDAPTLSNWYNKIDIKRLAIDGRNQSRGIWFHTTDHGLFENIRVNSTISEAVQLSSVREADFINLNIFASNASGTANLLLYEPSAMGSDENNNIRFFGGAIVYNGGQMLKVDSDSGAGSDGRNVSFFGTQLHYLDSAASTNWASIVNTNMRLIELNKANNVRFIGCNVRAGQNFTGTLISVGTAGRAPTGIVFADCRLSGEGTGVVGLSINTNAGRVTLGAQNIYSFPSGTSISGTTSVIQEVVPGNMSVDGVIDLYGNLRRRGAAGTSRGITWFSDASIRWVATCNEAAESGSDAGSDFQLQLRADAASASSVALHVTRATGNVGLGLGNTQPTELLDVSGSTIRLRTPIAAITGTAVGNAGDIMWGPASGTTFLYVCTSTNSWSRVALSPF